MFQRELFSCAIAITRSPDRAEDAIQEAFVRLFRSRLRPRNLKAYVFRAVRNAALDQLRRDGSFSDKLTDIDLAGLFDPEPGPEDSAVGREFQRHVAMALASLSPNERETIVNHLYGGLTFREISKVQDAPLGTVTAWYRRGLERMRTFLKE